MGAVKDEAAGLVKKAAGKVTGNDELRHKGEDQEQHGLEQDQADQARRMGGGMGTDEPETHGGGQPGDSPSA